MSRVAKTIGVSLATAPTVGDGSVVTAGGTIAAGVTNGIEIHSAAAFESSATALIDGRALVQDASCGLSRIDVTSAARESPFRFEC